MAYARLSSIVLCVISCRGQSIVTGIGGTLESYNIDSPVLHQEASLQKICALEKTKQPKSSSSLLVCQLRAHYYCTTTILLLYGLACKYCQQCCDMSVHSTVVPPLLYVYAPL